MYWSNLIVPYCSPIFQIYQVDGLMAGRLFWEGEYGVRISTAWESLLLCINTLLRINTMEIRHSNVTLLHLGSNLHCLMPTRLPIIILSIMLVMEIRHSLQILDLLKFESPLLEKVFLVYRYIFINNRF